jgi:alpha-D-ribose 1-methylphosphonate 5-triphosphate synthase subunit PhnH
LAKQFLVLVLQSHRIQQVLAFHQGIRLHFTVQAALFAQLLDSLQEVTTSFFLGAALLG